MKTTQILHIQARAHVQQAHDCAVLRGIAGSVLAAILWMWSALAQANCWRDAGLEQRLEQLALARFPAVARQLPSVEVCDTSHFAPGVAGTYGTGGHNIRIPVWALQDGRLDGIVCMASAMRMLHWRVPVEQR